MGPRAGLAAAMMDEAEMDDDFDYDDGGGSVDSEGSPMDIDDDDGGSDDDADGGGRRGASDGAATAAARTAATLDDENDALADSFRDPKMARVLTSIPQSLPFDRRVKLFHSLIEYDKLKTQDETADFRRMMMDMAAMREDGPGQFTGREQVEIRRDRLYDDSMSHLNGLGRKLRRKVQVTFINRHGAAEAGIDGGGVFKEFLDDLIKEAFDPSGGGTGRRGDGPPALFTETPLQTLRVNVELADDEDAARWSPQILSHYEFLGRVLGKAVYESILVEPQFCLPFLNQLLGRRNALDDLKNLDPEYYRHLTGLRSMTSDQIDRLGLTFELTYSASAGGRRGGTARTVELLPNGSSIAVTKRNVVQYVHLVAHRKMNVDPALPTRSFLRGFRDLVPAPWVRLFSGHELQKIVSGDDAVRGIDVRGLRSVMRYAGGYHPDQPVMRWFWEVLEEMSPDRQRKFLKFMTSCSRQPLLGFGALAPLPCVQQIRLRDDELGMGYGEGGGGGEARLPTSSTCMNLLKLPNYGSKEVLREKLLYAIEAGAGFELS